jgi:hypothetical protein
MIQFILFPHLRLGLQSGHFLSSFPTKTLYTPLLSPISATYPAHLIILSVITRIIFGEEKRSLSYSLCGYPRNRVTPSLFDPNILLSTLFSNTLGLGSPPQCERPSFTPIQNKRQNCICEYLNLYTQDGSTDVLQFIPRSVASLLAHLWEASRCVERFLSFFVCSAWNQTVYRTPIRAIWATYPDSVFDSIHRHFYYKFPPSCGGYLRIPGKGVRLSNEIQTNSKTYIQTKPLCDNV